MIERLIGFITLCAIASSTAILTRGAEIPFRAGVAKAIITPSQDIWMSGYASRKEPSQGKVHDLFAKALALEDRHGNRIVLVTTDLIGLPADVSEQVAAEVQKETGLPHSALMLTSSHTHCGPVLRKNLETMYNLTGEQWERVTQYTADLQQKLVRVICESLEDLKPARLFRGTGSAGFAVNRRQYTLDGLTIGVNPIGPVDHDVPVLKAVDERDALIAIVFGYACHNTTLSFYQLCGDYAGFAQEYLEGQYPGCPALFFCGCGADANPNPRGTLDLAKAHGQELSQAVQKVLAGSMTEVQGPLRASYLVIDLPLTPAPSRTQLNEQLQNPNEYIQRRAKSLLARLDQQGGIPEKYPYPVQVWTVGNDFNLVALAGEVVVDYSLRLKHELGRDHVWVIGYANDVFGYIPSLRVLREGGYEADTSMIYYGLHGPWAPQVEEMIVKTVHELVKKNQS